MNVIDMSLETVKSEFGAFIKYAFTVRDIRLELLKIKTDRSYDLIKNISCNMGGF